MLRMLHEIEPHHRPVLRARQTQQPGLSTPATARWPGGDLSELLPHLQRTAGNQAVNALLQRWTASVAPPEQQCGLGRSGPLPLDLTGARPMREAEGVGGTATTDAVAGRDPSPVVAGPARVSRAIQRAGNGPTVLGGRTGLSSPDVLPGIKFAPLVTVLEDGVPTFQIDDDGSNRFLSLSATGGADNPYSWTLGAATRSVDLQTAIAGDVAPMKGDYASSATTSFAVRADGSISGISHIDCPLGAHLTGITATAVPLQISPTPHRIRVMMGVSFDASATVADTQGTSHTTGTSSGTTTATTVGTSHSEGDTVTGDVGVGGQIGDGKGSLNGKVQWSHKGEKTSGYSNTMGTSTGQQATDGTTAGQTTTHPGVQNRLAITVTVELDSPPRAARSASMDIANFGVDRANVTPTMTGRVHKFLVSENKLHEDLLALLQKGQAKVTIAGYASVTGPKDPSINEDYNTKLAKRRAMAMKDALVKGYGIRDDAFYPAIAYGATTSDPHTDDPKKREDPAMRRVTIEVTIAQQGE